MVASQFGHDDHHLQSFSRPMSVARVFESINISFWPERVTEVRKTMERLEPKYGLAGFFQIPETTKP
jgi:hypothetical protein